MPSEVENWERVIDKMALMFNERVREIRRDVPADLVLNKAMECLVAAGFQPKDSGAVDADMTPLSELFAQINGDARARIIFLANKIGSVVPEDAPRSGEKFPGSRFAGEDQNSLYMRIDGLIIRILKEDAIKYLTLGALE
jgi:hypothetical protein